MSRCGVKIDLVGADDITRLTEEIEHLVASLRRKTAEFRDHPIRYEMSIKQPSLVHGTDLNKQKIDIKLSGIDDLAQSTDDVACLADKLRLSMNELKAHAIRFETILNQMQENSHV